MASDVEIVVGAKDQASAILKHIAGETRQMSKSVEKMSRTSVKATARVEGAFKSLRRAAGPLIGALVALKGARAAFSFGQSSFQAFVKQEEAVRRLTKAIELNGEAVSSVAGHQAFASTLQNLTNVGDEVTLGLMAQASALGVTDGELQNVTKTAIGLAEATGINLETALKRVMGATAGVYGELGEMIPAIREAATEEEKLAIITELANKGLQQKADQAQTAAGAAERASNAWGDFKEQIGELIAPMMQLVHTGLAVAAETLQVALVPALDAAGGMAKLFSNAVSTMTSYVVGSITAIEVVVTNLPTIWEIAITSIQLQITRLVETVKHAFTVTIPAYAGWFADNFVNLLTDAFNLVVTVAKNNFLKIGRFIEILWDFISSGGEGGYKKLADDLVANITSSLTEGFEAKTETLPDIIGRQVTEKEKSLQDKIGRLAGGLGDSFSKKYAERMSKFSVLGDSDALDALGVGALGGAEAGLGGAKGAASTALSASESRLRTAGGAEQGIDKVAKNTKATAVAAQEQLIKMEKIAAALESTSKATGLNVDVVG